MSQWRLLILHVHIIPWIRLILHCSSLQHHCTIKIWVDGAMTVSCNAMARYGAKMSWFDDAMVRWCDDDGTVGAAVRGSWCDDAMTMTRWCDSAMVIVRWRGGTMTMTRQCDGHGTMTRWHDGARGDVREDSKAMLCRVIISICFIAPSYRVIEIFVHALFARENYGVRC